MQMKKVLQGKEKSKTKNIGKRRVSPSTTASLISCASATATAVFKAQLLKLKPFKVVISTIGYWKIL